MNRLWHGQLDVIVSGSEVVNLETCYRIVSRPNQNSYLPALRRDANTICDDLRRVRRILLRKVDAITATTTLADSVLLFDATGEAGNVRHLRCVLQRRANHSGFLRRDWPVECGSRDRS